MFDYNEYTPEELGAMIQAMVENLHSRGEDPEDNRPEPGILIPSKEYEKWMTMYSRLCESLAIHFDDYEPKYAKDFQKATDSMILAASRESEPTYTEPDQPEIIPAGPLREVPEKGQRYYAVYVWVSSCGEIRHEIEVNFWGDEDNSDEDLFMFQAGLLFPNTPEGKAGAELRAKQGIVPYPVRPAKALTKPLEECQKYWLVDNDGEILIVRWRDDDFDYLSEGRIFPYTKAGKLGAAMFGEK